MTIDEQLEYWEALIARDQAGYKSREEFTKAIALIRHLRPFGFSDGSVDEALSNANDIRQGDKALWLLEDRPEQKG